MSNDFWPGLHADPWRQGHTSASASAALTPDLLERWAPLAEQVHQRGKAQALPFPLTHYASPGRQFLGSDATGRARQGVNFTSGDHLNLATHPQVIAAAAAALDHFGPHGAGTQDRTGRSASAALLEAEIAAYAGFAETTLFPTGWNAGFAVVRTLVRRGDHVVAPAGLQGGIVEGIAASGARLHRFRGPGTDQAAQRLADLRAADAGAGILLVVESLSGLDGHLTDICALQHLCHSCRATLLLDVTPDFGAMGPGGLGVLERQHLTGCADVVIGDLSRVFAANGGFVASNHPALRCALRHGPSASGSVAPQAPAQVAAAGAALSIVVADEGAGRRARLMATVLQLRNALDTAGFPPLGVPAPVVLVAAGRGAAARKSTVALQTAGVFALLVEAALVPGGQSLWQFQVMADHKPADIDCLVQALRSLGSPAGLARTQPVRPPPSGVQPP